MNLNFIDESVINISELDIESIKNYDLLVKEYEHTNRLLEDNKKYQNQFNLLIYSSVGTFLLSVLLRDILLLLLLIPFILLALYIVIYERQRVKVIIDRKNLILRKLTKIEKESNTNL